MRCSRCQSKAITFIRYNGEHLCSKHFNEFFEKRVKRTVRSQCDLGKLRRVAVAISGGKDSSVALFMLHKIMSKRKGSELMAITVDEGIKGYRNESMVFAARLCKTLGIQQTVVTFKEEMGYEMDSIIERDVLPCSYCGVFRRQCLNLAAKRAKADVLATGLNLDDTAQSILMNMAKADIGKLARLGPHGAIQKGLVPRIQPLREIPEKEVFLYAVINDIEFHNANCPYSDRAMRLKFRELMAALEDDMPGTRHSILKTYDAIRPCLLKRFPLIDLIECKSCGEPSLDGLCKACELRASLKV